MSESTKRTNQKESAEQFPCTEIIGEKLLPVCKRRVYCAGDTIVYAGQPLFEVGFIESGSASGILYLPDGDYLETFRMDCYYGVIGLAELLNKNGTIQYTIAAAETTAVLYLPLDVVGSTLLEDARAMRLYATMLTANVSAGSMRSVLYRKGATEKLRCYLRFYLSGSFAGGREEAVLDISYQKIAAALSVSTQSVYRGMRELTKMGLVGRRGKKISVTASQYERLTD